MAVTQSYSTDEETDRRLTEMFSDDKRTRSNFLSWLINEEYERRNMPTTIGEAAARLPVPAGER